MWKISRISRAKYWDFTVFLMKSNPLEKTNLYLLFLINSLPYTFSVVKKEDLKSDGNGFDFIEEEILETRK